MSPFFFITEMKHIPAILIFSVMLIFQLSVIGEAGPGDSEAYYYSWSRNLNLSYYDHPAGIAFLIRLSTSIFGHNTFGLRFFSTLLINLSLLILYITSFFIVQNEKRALYSMLFLIATPAFIIGGVSASPEPPLIFFCSLSLFFFSIYIRKAESKYLYAAFVLTGIAFNIKYPAIFLTTAYFYILIRHFSLDKKTFIRLAVITFIPLLPVLIWNILHKGASFEYHLLSRVNPLYIPLNTLKFIGGQMLYFNPILTVLLSIFLFRKIREKSKNLLVELFLVLLILSAVPMLLIRDSEPHWSSLVYPVAALLFSEEPDRYKKTFHSALGLNLILSGLFIYHILSPAFTEGLLKKQNPRYDITNELFGWENVAENIDYIVATEKINKNETLLVSNHYTMCGQLMFATKSLYKVACRGKRCNQFKIDDIKDERNIRLFIFVTDNRFTEIPRFYRDGAIEQKIKIYRGERVVREFHLFVKKVL